MDIKLIINLYKKLVEQIKNNIKVIIYTVLVFVLLIIFYQIYLFKHNQKILELSILFDQAKTNIDSNELNKIRIMSKIDIAYIQYLICKNFF